MKTEEIPLELRYALCVRDKRYPDHADLFPPEEYENVVPREDCHCDSCFRGQDRLAVLAIEMYESLVAIVSYWQDMGDLMFWGVLSTNAILAVKKARGEVK